MNQVTIEVAGVEQVRRRTAAAFRGERQGDFLSFASVELLWKVLTPRRWEMLRAMTGREPMSLRALARLTERDVKTTHGDVHVLLGAGVLQRTSVGELVFPYDVVHVAFTIETAA